ncbi:MAG: hypothetical protein ABL890_03650 [Candidatus Peribacteraceae bacterium]
MRHFLGTPLAAFTLLFLSASVVGSVAAAPFNPKVSRITSYQDFLFGTREVRDNINSVQCGGWFNPETGLEDSTVPIPTVNGVPGRANQDPLGNPISGVGTRGDFEYPDSAMGFMTACNITNRDINPEQWCLINMNTATPEQCKKLFKKLTEELPQKVLDGSFSSRDPSVTCTTSRFGGIGRPPIVERHYCFMPPYTTPGTGDPPYNCTGQACRTTNPPEFRCAGPIVIARQSSFHRHYPTNVSTPDGQTWDFDTECYEQYKEDDPKDKVTSDGDDQCEVVLSETATIQQDEYPGWRDRNDVIGQKGETAPTLGAVREPDPAPRSATEPWKLDTQTNLAIVDYYAWARDRRERGMNPRLSDTLGAAIESKHTASRVGGTAYTDHFDDTAERDIAEFWEREQRTLLALTREPNVHIILPALYLHGLTEDNPLFDLIEDETPLPTGVVQVTLRAGLEDVGAALQSIAESRLLRVEEVKIPVLVPLAGDIDQRIAAWTVWKSQEELEARVAERESYAGDADAVIDKLKQYKVRLEEVRRLRNATPLFLQRVLERDHEMRRVIADWYASLADQIETAIRGGESRQELQRIWKLLQRGLHLADQCQLLWCSNQRFSTPIYSLLDPWWGDRSSGDTRNFSYAPESITDLGIRPSDDYRFDFSRFSFSGNVVRVPVFELVQVRINLPTPQVGKRPELAEMPDLPPVPPDDMLLFDLPTLEADALPTIEIPLPPDLNDVKNRLRNLRERLDGTSLSDQTIQEERLKNGTEPNTPDGFPPALFSRGSMLDSVCRFTKSVTEHRPSPQSSTRRTIVHVENDLTERIARLFARWMPNTAQDFLAKRERVESSATLAERRCTHGLICLLLPSEVRKTEAYTWFVPLMTPNTSDLVDRVRNMTLPRSDANPYALSPLNILRTLFPSIPLPSNIHLVTYE